MKILHSLLAALSVFALALTAPATAGDKGTKVEAQAMVKKAVEAIKKDGADKAYAAFADKSNAAFHDRDLYVLVYDLSGNCLVHGTNPKLTGKNNTEAQDTDGVYYIKDRMELAKTKASFWQDYKFTDPVTKKIAPKSTYCEKLNQSVVCVGIYK